MTYNKTVWKNGQTKLNADNLNHIEDGISKASTNVDNLSNKFDSISTIYETKTDAVNKLSEAKQDAATKANKVLQDSKSYTDTKIEEVKSSIGSSSSTSLAEAKKYTDSKKIEVVNESKSYTDELSTTISITYETKADAASKAASTLNSSKAYTNVEINKIKLTTDQLNAVNSGITQAKVSKYDNYETLINSKPNTNNVYTKQQIDERLETKQDKLIAGANIEIQGTTISSKLTPATVNVIGGIKVGDGLKVDSTGLLGIESISDEDLNLILI